MALAAGTKLGPYEIVALIVAGGMGEVYRARDTRLDRTVAIKVLNSSVVASPELRQRFESEARTISRTKSSTHLHLARPATIYQCAKYFAILPLMAAFGWFLPIACPA